MKEFISRLFKKHFYITRGKCYELCKKYYSHSWRSPVDFYREVIRSCSPNSLILLNAGCGESKEKINYKGLSKRFVGIDMDFPSLSKNRACDNLINGSLEYLPFKDSTFDIIVCKDVLEHLRTPIIVFQEFSRILKKEGFLIILTPSIYNYVSIISRITPFRLHTFFNKLRGINATDIFPTYYRANSIRSLKELGKGVGLKMEDHMMIQKWPSYLIFSVILFRIGIMYERILNRFELLQFLRSAIVAVYKKE
ncbi:MAG: class I SAM-dependent methyltransferase [Acetobacterium woodii]|nr:class I SAM-dependent methyltransferase [Acetobacterium woodii]